MSPPPPAPRQISLFDEPERASRGDGAERRPRGAASTLRVAVLGSGSRGNSVVVESAGRRILLDAGFAGRELERRLRLLGIEPSSLEAVVLTHDHSDHCRGVLQLVKRHGLPVHATAGTLASKRLRGLRTGREIRADRPFEVAGVEIEAFAIPHDAREPVGLLLQDGEGRRVGLVADLGVRSRSVWQRLRDLDLLFVESNHDLELLRRGPYPWYLKRRIASRWGHLSNDDAASGVEEIVGDRLETVVLYHLSETNNRPELALATMAEALERRLCRARLLAAEQGRPTAWLAVAGRVGYGSGIHELQGAMGR